MIYKINMPNGNVQKLYTDKNKTTENKIEVLEKYILNYDCNGTKVKDYCNNHWLFQGKIDPYKFNHEDNVKNLLDRAATFLLLGEFKDGMLISDYKQEKIRNFEKVLSSLGSDIQEYLWGIDFNENYNTGNLEDLNILLSDSGINITGDVEIDLDTVNSIKFNNRGRKSDLEHNIHNFKKKQHTYSQKIKKIFNTENKDIYELYELKNRDLCKLNNIIAENVINFENDEQRKKWLNKLAKNVFGQVIQEYRIKKIRGIKGLIDSNLPYKWNWCYIDTDNKFTYNGDTYQLDNSVEQYKVGLDNQCEMDMIFVIEQNDEVYYFDMKLDQISNNFVQNTKLKI